MTAPKGKKGDAGLVAVLCQTAPENEREKPKRKINAPGESSYFIFHSFLTQLTNKPVIFIKKCHNYFVLMY